MMNCPKISLKAARVNANLGQKEAAKMLNISVSTLQSYENGITVPDILMAQKMEEVYKYPHTHIFFGCNAR